MKSEGDLQLSIIVPVLNRNEALKRAVGSVVSKTSRISVVVVDDGSAPEFSLVADSVAELAGGRVQVVHQENRGPAAARNVGLRCINSPFVMFLDSDDELAATAFGAIDRYLLRRDDVGMVCGAVRVVSPDGAVTISQPEVLPGIPWAKLTWFSGSFAVRTDVARGVGGYDEALHFGENTDFIIRLAEECRKRSLEVAATSDVFSIIHEASGKRSRYDGKRLEAAMHLLRRGRLDLQRPSDRAKLHAIAAVNAARVGQYRLSVKHAVLAARTEPRDPRHFARLALSLTGPFARRRWLRTRDES